MRILETALYAENLRETAAFYRDVLGLAQVAAVSGQHVFFRAGDQVLLLFRPSATALPPAPDSPMPVPPHGTTGPGHVCFAATRAGIDAWRARLTAAGVAIDAEFDWPQGGRSLYFRDPAGNSVEFAEPRIWGL